MKGIVEVLQLHVKSTQTRERTQTDENLRWAMQIKAKAHPCQFIILQLIKNVCVFGDLMISETSRKKERLEGNRHSLHAQSLTVKDFVCTVGALAVWGK